MALRWIAPVFGGLDVLTLVESDVPPPQPGEVSIAVRAVGMNPADYKFLGPGPDPDPSRLPLSVGSELAGVVTAVGPQTTSVSVGDEVLAFPVRGAYATAVTVPAADVFAKPPNLSFPEAANLLLAGCTAAELVHVAGVRAGETVLVHGASGGVGTSVLQQVRALGARVIGTARPANFETVRRYGAMPVAYGDGLAERVRALAPEGVDRALDCVGTDEAIDVSLELVADRSAIATIAAQHRAATDGIVAVSGSGPASEAFRNAARAQLVASAAAGSLTVAVARTFPFTEAVAALRLLATGHAGGKLALVV